MAPKLLTDNTMTADASSTTAALPLNNNSGHSSSSGGDVSNNDASATSANEASQTDKAAASASDSATANTATTNRTLSRVSPYALEENRCLGADYEPGPNDVVCARGAEAYSHEGNKRFRDMIASRMEEYAAALSNKEKKSIIVSQVMYEIRNKGTFLKPEGGKWYEVSDAAAREKVGQGFRDLLHTRYRSSNKAKNSRRLPRNKAAQGMPGAEPPLEPTDKRKTAPKRAKGAEPPKKRVRKSRKAVNASDLGDAPAEADEAASGHNANPILSLQQAAYMHSEHQVALAARSHSPTSVARARLAAGYRPPVPGENQAAVADITAAAASQNPAAIARARLAAAGYNAQMSESGCHPPTQQPQRSGKEEEGMPGAKHETHGGDEQQQQNRQLHPEADPRQAQTSRQLLQLPFGGRDLPPELFNKYRHLLPSSSNDEGSEAPGSQPGLQQSTALARYMAESSGAAGSAPTRNAAVDPSSAYLSSMRGAAGSRLSASDPSATSPRLQAALLERGLLQQPQQQGSSPHSSSYATGNLAAAETADLIPPHLAAAGGIPTADLLNRRIQILQSAAAARRAAERDLLGLPPLPAAAHAAAIEAAAAAVAEADYQNAVPSSLVAPTMQYAQRSQELEQQLLLQRQRQQQLQKQQQQQQEAQSHKVEKEGAPSAEQEPTKDTAENKPKAPVESKQGSHSVSITLTINLQCTINNNNNKNDLKTSDNKRDSDGASGDAKDSAAKKDAREEDNSEEPALVEKLSESLARALAKEFGGAGVSIMTSGAPSASTSDA